MQAVVSNAEMREADRHTIQNLNISAGELMNRAGKAIADEVEAAAKKLGKTDILVVCGTGNNGGDGYVCAEELKERGLSVKIYQVAGELSPDCLNAKNVCKCGYSAHICGSIVVDCLFGTGLSREITGEYAEVISKINALGVFVISADIPSGINGNNGKIYGVAVKADITVAIGEIKYGLILADGLDYCGKIIRKDIGITFPQKPTVFTNCPADMARFYPKRPRNSHKGSYGSANIIAGSNKYIGAAALAVEAALKSGCGFVKLTTTEKVKLSLAPRLPQTIFLDAPDENSNAHAIGMGMGVSEQLYSTLKNLLSMGGAPLLIDADAINTLAKFGADILKDKKRPVVLTPHVKEFSRLTSLSVEEILDDPVNLSRSFAKKYGVVLLLKGASTVITDGDKTVINTTGNSALAKAGSGDMLSGFACGLMARGLCAFDAAVCAAFTLGTAAEIAAQEKTEYCVTSKDVINNLHFSIKRLTN